MKAKLCQFCGKKLIGVWNSIPHPEDVAAGILWPELRRQRTTLRHRGYDRHELFCSQRCGYLYAVTVLTNARIGTSRQGNQ